MPTVPTVTGHSSTEVDCSTDSGGESSVPSIVFILATLGV